MQTVAQIKALLARADEEGFAVLERSLRSDQRKGVQDALAACRRRLDAISEERTRIKTMFNFERALAQGRLLVGLDEVGRGPLAGPLSVGAVVFDEATIYVEGLNDSKQIPEHKRDAIADSIREVCRGYAVVHIAPQTIDAIGITASLRQGFSQALMQLEEQGIVPEVVLLDGNPLHFDPREINVVKGDAKCASIAAASLVAKTARDALMVDYDRVYPGYDFASSKGYGSKKHLNALDEQGLSPIHRRSFCGRFLQASLFD